MVYALRKGPAIKQKTVEVRVIFPGASHVSHVGQHSTGFFVLCHVTSLSDIRTTQPGLPDRGSGG